MKSLLNLRNHERMCAAVPAASICAILSWRSTPVHIYPNETSHQPLHSYQEIHSLETYQISFHLKIHTSDSLRHCKAPKRSRIVSIFGQENKRAISCFNMSCHPNYTNLISLTP